MRKPTKGTDVRPEAIEAVAGMGLSLEDLMRQGARTLLQQALEAEVQSLTTSYANVTTIDGQRVVVRNGYQAGAQYSDGSWSSAGEGVPKVRDRSGSGIKFNSELVPALCAENAKGVSRTAMALSQRDIDRRHGGGAPGLAWR